jgi:virulence-associated protein VapD
MSSHRPTTLERAYALAREGRCRTVSDIKQALASEGFDRIQDSLYGPTLSADLRKLCQQHYVPPPEDVVEG